MIIARQRLGRHVPTHVANSTAEEVFSMWPAPCPVLGNGSVNGREIIGGSNSEDSSCRSTEEYKKSVVERE
jgi:hypothetical protein